MPLNFWENEKPSLDVWITKTYNVCLFTTFADWSHIKLKFSQVSWFHVLLGHMCGHWCFDNYQCCPCAFNSKSISCSLYIISWVTIAIPVVPYFISCISCKYKALSITPCLILKQWHYNWLSINSILLILKLWVHKHWLIYNFVSMCCDTSPGLKNQ